MRVFASGNHSLSEDPCSVQLSSNRFSQYYFRRVTLWELDDLLRAGQEISPSSAPTFDLMVLTFVWVSGGKRLIYMVGATGSVREKNLRDRSYGSSTTSGPYLVRGQEKFCFTGMFAGVDSWRSVMVGSWPSIGKGSGVGSAGRPAKYFRKKCEFRYQKCLCGRAKSLGSLQRTDWSYCERCFGDCGPDRRSSGTC
jgi:hypothetical protein